MSAIPINEILQKLQIKELKPMQQEALQTITQEDEVLLLSPTGSGKTLAYLLPLLAKLNPNLAAVQLLILVPSRELALQIEQVVRSMGSGFKSNAVYGGRAMTNDKADLRHPPAILIGTPGRLADHLRRGTVAVDQLENLVLDEFDKSLEVGFEEEMREIIAALPALKRKVLTSATEKVAVPDFVGLRSVSRINYLDEGSSQLELLAVTTKEKDKLPALHRLLEHLGPQPGIVFCNFRESIERVSEYLSEKGIRHGCFYGGLEQKERERALLKFRNGSHRLLLATDLAARGIDIPDLQFIIHFHLPPKADEFTHRNGRTARMDKGGRAYLLQWEEEELPDFIAERKPAVTAVDQLTKNREAEGAQYSTIMLSAGRKDKISKGDVAGFFIKQGKLASDQLGLIEIKQDCAFVAVPRKQVKHLLTRLNNEKVKNRKVRLSVV